MPQKTVDAALIKRFSQVFKESGLTQGTFGKRVGVGQSAIGNILGGGQEPSKAILRATITEFDISPEWLLEGKGTPQKVKEAAPAAGGPYVTREEAARQVGQLEGRIGVLERALENLAEAVRELAIREREAREREK